jgi:hypothetical protein
MTNQAIQLKSVTNPTVERPNPEVPEKVQRQRLGSVSSLWRYFFERRHDVWLSVDSDNFSV